MNEVYAQIAPPQCTNCSRRVLMSSHIVLMQASLLKLFLMTDWGLHIKANIMFCELYKILSLDGLKSGSLYKFNKLYRASK